MEGTGVFALRVITPDVAQVVFRFLAVSEMVLVPLGVAMGYLPEDVQTIWNMPVWRLESATMLHHLLSTGPYRRWVRNSTGLGI